MVNKNRALYIFKYLWDHTDEEHPATTADIIAYLASMGISTTRKTVAEDAAELQNSGFDVVCNRSRQNEYFIGTRHLELAELKLLVDAVQAARFISPKKSRELIGKVTGLISPHQGESLRRSLFVDGKVKTGNEAVYYAVDILHTAIQQQKTIYRIHPHRRKSGTSTADVCMSSLLTIWSGTATPTMCAATPRATARWSPSG